MVGCELAKGRGGKRLEEEGAPRPFDVVLYHVADVEKAGFFPCPFVGLADAEVAVLDGHLVAAEGDHLATMLEVDVV